MIDGVTNAGAIPALERLMQFAGGRHRLIVHNIANLDTPGFQPRDVSVEAFQASMREAMDRTRRERGTAGGRLPLHSTAEVEVLEDRLLLHPTKAGANILFHDGNDRNPERIMQALVENFMAFRLAGELLRNRFDLINTAIRERL